MTQLPCLLCLLLTTGALALQTKATREAQPSSPEAAAEEYRADSENMQPEESADMISEDAVNMTENDEDLLTDRDENTLYNGQETLDDVMVISQGPNAKQATEAADEPNPSAKGKTFLTPERIQKLMAQAEADMAADKDLVTESNSRLFMKWTKDRDLVIKPEQYQSMDRPIVDAEGSYRVLETKTRAFAGRNPKALEKELKVIEEQKAAEQKAAEEQAAQEEEEETDDMEETEEAAVENSDDLSKAETEEEDAEQAKDEKAAESKEKDKEEAPEKEEEEASEE
mmetsp:Transcript_91729/g.158841  ORF Transcript_91729/g.158841 Transcript_91729/m.158841 type:complete len:284 (-) Transcript_91729:74-925(-)